jgi:hypothetical protein
VAAAKGRMHATKAAAQKDALKSQGALAAARAKKKGALGELDLESELQGDDVEVTVKVEFPIGKLGMSMEKNCVSSVTGSPASELGIKKGWVLFSVAGQECPPSKVACITLCVRAQALCDLALQCRAFKHRTHQRTPTFLCCEGQAKISELIMGVFKEQKAGVVSFAFRTPITDGYDFCYKCNKFLGGWVGARGCVPSYVCLCALCL